MENKIEYNVLITFNTLVINQNHSIFISNMLKCVIHIKGSSGELLQFLIHITVTYSNSINVKSIRLLKKLKRDITD